MGLIQSYLNPNNVHCEKSYNFKDFVKKIGEYEKTAQIREEENRQKRREEHRKIRERIDKGCIRLILNKIPLSTDILYLVIKYLDVRGDHRIKYFSMPCSHKGNTIGNCDNCNSSNLYDTDSYKETLDRMKPKPIPITLESYFEKTCIICNKTKTLDKFTLHESKYNNTCKLC